MKLTFSDTAEGSYSAAMIRDPEQLSALVADIRDFVRGHWHPLEEEVERAGAIPEHLVDTLRRRGYFGWSIPHEAAAGGFVAPAKG